MPQVTLEQARAQLPDLVEAAIAGNEVVILKENQPAVKLVPLPPPGARPQFGSARGLITMAEDFDEPLEDFRDTVR
ncbi:MAG: DUF2281 domain-containing protein [Planctomycetes bacterium]|nr:DUF2281 domain-containing protein [Planctomycetota bacterium]